MKKRLFASLLMAGSLLLTACGDVDIKKIASAILDEDSSSAQSENGEISAAPGDQSQDSTEQASRPADQSQDPTEQASSSEEPVDPAVEENCVIKEDTEITIWSTFNSTYQAVLDNAALSLKKHEPHITVTIVKQGANYSGLKDMIVNGFAANNYPDMAPAYPDSVNDFIDAAKALNVEKYMKNAEYGWSEDDFADVYEAYLEEGSSYSIPGTYSLPLAKSTEAMFYDRRIISVDLSSIDETINNGKPISEAYLNNLTWEELFGKLCPALLTYNDQLISAGKTPLIDKNVEALNNKYAVVGYDSDDNLFITLAKQYDLGYTSVDPLLGTGSLDFVKKDADGRFSGVSEEYKNLMKMFNDAFTKNYILTQGTYGAYTSKLSNNNACLFSIGSTGGTSNQFSASNPKDIGVANIPHAAGRPLSVINQGPSMAFLNHKDDNRAIASWLFYKEFTQGDFPIVWATTTGYTPIRQSVAESDDYMDYCDISEYDEATSDILMARAAAYSGTVGPYLFSSPVFTGSSTARSEVGGLMQNVLTNGETGGVISDDNLVKFFKDAYDHTVLKMK